MPVDDRPTTIRVGNQRVELPEGVPLELWELERRQGQNPRIRAFVGSIRRLEKSLDSNFAILHCSPERLERKRSRLLEVARLVRDEIVPILERRSPIESIEEGLRDLRAATATFSGTVMADMERLERMDIVDDQAEIRRLLCVLLGKFHSFLLDSFGRIMASDPRSRYDADYFLSRRFPRDIEEAEWLLTTVERLDVFLSELDYGRSRTLHRLGLHLRASGELPGEDEWAAVEELIGRMRQDLMARLKEIVGLRGIRYDEMVLLDGYCERIPAETHLLAGFYRVAREIEAAEERRSAEGGGAYRGVLARRLAQTLLDLDGALRDLSTFVPLWLSNISMRRALMVGRAVGPGD